MNEDNGLIFWYLKNKRNLPWRQTRDPYRIWLSEIILQQTRVEQGTNYYLRFINTFPDVRQLSSASEDEVLKLWQGLGYYSRARNLHATARFISNDLNGIFPDTYRGLLALKGVGPYTAAAIASFAYRLPHAVVDGNVSRVLARVFDVATPINTTSGQKEIQALADSFLDRDRPDLHNQAMMELGATVCTPKNPRCEICPLNHKCLSLLKKNQNERPLKIPNKKPVKRHIDYAVIETADRIVFRKRTEKDIWQGLHDFAALEGYPDLNGAQMNNFVAEAFPETEFKSIPEGPDRSYTHLLSHRRIEARFWRYLLRGDVDNNSLYLSVSKEDVHKLAVPRPIQKYLEESDLI